MMQVGTLQMNELQNTIFRARYAMPDELIWSQLVDRVSTHLARAEVNGSFKPIQQNFYEAIDQARFIPGGRVLYGSGRKFGGLLNCFSLGVEDNRTSIAKLAHDMYLITTVGGGVGVCYNKIRPKGDPIQGVMSQAPGVVNEIKKIDAIGGCIRAAGDRGPALIATLSVSHPEIRDFIMAKLDTKELNNHNISVEITRKFVEAVKRDKEWSFSFGGREYCYWRILRWNDEYGQPKEKAEELLVHGVDIDWAMNVANRFCRQDGEIGYFDKFECLGRKKYKARELWDLIIKNNLARGEPGLLMVDNIVDNFATSYMEDYNSSNPCGEAMLPAYGNCCLGSIVLSRHFDRETGHLDWDLLGNTIKTGIRMLDNVLDMNVYPLPECKDTAGASRRIGLGVMGLHHLLVELGLKYGDQKSLNWIDKLFTFIRNTAFEASIDLAIEKGPFSRFDAELYTDNDFIKRLPSRTIKRIKKHGIRNAVLLSIAPTGTISMVAGTSSGIEPIFAPVYERRYRHNGAYARDLVVDRVFADRLRDGLPCDHIVGAYDLSAVEHLNVQGAIQDNIDQAVSKTINVVQGTDLDELSDAILDFTAFGKGVTTYPQGSRDNEPLTPKNHKEMNHDELLNLANKYAGVVNDSCVNGTCEV